MASKPFRIWCRSIVALQIKLVQREFGILKHSCRKKTGFWHFFVYFFLIWQAIMSEAFVYMERVTSSGFLTPPVCLPISLSSEHTRWLWSAWSWDIERGPWHRVKFRWNQTGISSWQKPRIHQQKWSELQQKKTLISALLEAHIHPAGFFRMCGRCSSGQFVSLCLQVYLFTSHLETEMCEIQKEARGHSSFCSCPVCTFAVLMACCPALTFFLLHWHCCLFL